MARATLGRLGLRGFVPRSLGARPAVALERAFARPFADVVDDAFEPLAAVDPGALWVLRRVDVRIAVPASEPDPLVQSRRVAAGIALAVAKAVAGGPSSDAVRFASRAAYVAAYVRARLAGHGGSWVFERFADLSPLTPLDALPAAARIAEIELIEVIAELATVEGWTRMLAAAAPGELDRLAVAIERRLTGVTAPAESLAAVSAARALRLAHAAGRPSVRIASGARARLDLIGDLAASRPVDAGLVAAIWRLEPAMPSAEAGTVAERAAARAVEERATVVDGAGVEGPVASRTPADDTGPAVFAAAGAPAFLLLPDLAELLADEPELMARTAAAAAVRAAVLGGVLGDRVDAADLALGVAAGVAHVPEPDDWDALLAGPVTACAERIARDSHLGWQHPLDAEWVSPATARAAPIGMLSIALLRQFLRHLTGFAEARASHVVPQVLPLGGVVRLDDGLVEAILPSGPLHVLLLLAGLDAFAFHVPWIDARIVVGHEVTG
ncbi:hypothetical protein [Microbacterium sp. SSM24]|uniref:hypothetical protein n=1 Tax=Microbacterium sp. SSM24 TaxID=2991714 RepID=UPI0022279ACE|nr:hypothetical protein [Microbacterium sp. SSM24]MCW3494224.1 hypothetical protein [Microbacterium sp. SSM24]